MSKYNSAELRSIVDNVSALYSSLLSLGSHSDIVEAMLIYIVMEKVDVDTQTKWKDSLDFTKVPSWADCSKVLERRCQFLKSIDNNHTHAAPRNPDSQFGKSKNKNYKTGSFFAISNVSKHTCALCSKPDHTIGRCSRFNSMDVTQRFENIKRLGLCLNCLSKGHQVNNCSSTFKCKFCSRSHHSLLHRSQSSSTAIENGPSTSSADLGESSATVHTHIEKSSLKPILLANAMVLVRDVNGSYQLGRALLDSCSQLEFITDEFARRLRLPRTKQIVNIDGMYRIFSCKN